ncbi:hypothetical protein QBC34DRAFT_496737 [Podospora aff. communis PSN243]|uniref:Transferase n=1 Tax=Podospora aff. communis PSN243 TaxID=3040156 RepID=A0AAV9GH78_9PEZI|nr:hypothetical protein QBC34DRAFT_496737 [Podospora aff. communis PSN243]
MEETEHKLSPWDCDWLFQTTNPILAWAVEGELNADHLAGALREAISVDAPWLGGRLVLRENQNPRYSLRLPSPPPSGPAPNLFDVTVFEDPDSDLKTLIPVYVPSGHSTPVVNRCNTGRLPCLAPLGPFLVTADEAARQDNALLHLHFVRARDLWLICLAWRHVVMDATTLSQVVASWEKRLGGAMSVEEKPNVARPTLDKLADTLVISDEDATFPGWTRVSPLSMVGLLARAKLDKTRFGYPATLGTVYIPRAVVQKWVAEVAAELGEGEQVSRNDIVAAWFYKTAWATFAPGTETTLTRAVNLRGRHDRIALDATGNVLGLAAMPPQHSESLPAASLAELALASRKAVLRSIEPDHVLSFMRFLAHRARTGQLAVPGTTPFSRRCLLSSYVNLGLTAPNFGPGVEVRAALQLTSDPIVTRVIDDRDGGWRIHSRLPHIAWDAIEKALEDETSQLS